MKRILSSLTLAVLCSASLFAQRTIVKGDVLDALTRQGEPAAVLQFFRADDSATPVAYTTTDLDGTFSQVLNGKGAYTLLFSGIGRQERKIPFTLDGEESLDLGDILIEDDIEALASASVTAQRPLVKMEVDRLSYNVENDVDSKTATVLDMLRKVPMVTVDGQDNITVNGSSSFQVTVDGKPSQMFSGNPSQIFKMMPASFVKDIQVITNPGVRYDAEGVGGVLNLVTNREATGGENLSDAFYGSVRLMGNTRGGGGGLFLSQQSGKFSWSLNTNGMFNKMPASTSDITREMLNSAAGSTKTHSESSMTHPMEMGNLSASYEFDAQNLISATVGLMHFGGTSNGLTTTTISGLGGTEFSYSGNSTTKTSSNSFNASVDFQHLWADNPARSLIFSYQFSLTPSKTLGENSFSTALSSGLDLTNRRTDGLQRSGEHTFQVDFTSPLGTAGTLSTGLKFISRHNSSDQQQYLWDGSAWAYNAAASVDYDYYNRIGALYTEYKANLGPVSLLGGVRYEYTWQNVNYAAGQGNSFNTGYGSLVPTASLQYNITQTQNIGLSYNMRISRPGISYLNPYVDTSDPTARSYGNSSLDVERGHTVSLVYNLYSPKWTVNLTLREQLIAGGISSYSFYDADGLLNTTYGNIVRTSATGLNTFINWNASSTTRIFLNGGLTWNDLRSEVLGQSNNGLSYNAMLGVQQALPADFSLSANLVSMGRNYSLQGWNSGMGMAMVGLTKNFLDDRLGISINYTLPLTGGKGMEMRSYTSGKDFRSVSVNVIPMQQLNISLSWSFGKQGNGRVKSARKSIKNDDIINIESTSESMDGGLMGGSGAAMGNGAGMGAGMR